MYIGDKMLACPRSIEESVKIYVDLGLDWKIERGITIIENASKLVEMNNEIYDKHQNTTWLQERIDILNEHNMKRRK